MKRTGLAASGVAALAGVVLVASSASFAGSDTDAQALDAACVSAIVHYEPASTDPTMPKTPWVSAGRRAREIIGYLFYYGPELQNTKRLTIYVGGRRPDGGRTKILWVPRRAGSSLLTITGERLDGPGRFRQEQRVARAGGMAVFPSIVNVPKTGCWRLTVRNGRGVSARLAVLAIASPSVG